MAGKSALMDPASHAAVITGTAALAGSLIGATSAITSGLLIEGHRRRREVRGTASALAGEIATVLVLTRVRRYKENFEEIANRLQAAQTVKIPNIGRKPTEKLQPVAEAFLTKIGDLPGDLPESVVKFYSVLSGINVDLVRMFDGEFDDQQVIALIREDLQLWRAAEALADGLVHELRRVSRQWWPRAKRRGSSGNERPSSSPAGPQDRPAT